MPDTVIATQLPSRTTTSTRWPRKWSTLGGRCTSSSTTVIPTNDADLTENSSKTNGHHRHSTSLFRKSSTISRTNGTPVTPDENSSTLKKSRSLMNVLRSKLNSPAVLRRFRSKSRESTKQTVTELNGHTTNQQEEPKQSNNEQITTRRSRKRDPSPMRRLANRISQLTTRHQNSPSTERQKKSPSKSSANDAHEDEKRKSLSPTHNQDEVDHINACYDKILAKFSTNNNQRNTSNDDPQNRSLSTISMNGSLLSNDFLNNSQRISSPLPPDDPILQARKQSNIKLNCILSGYSLTTSFANHEKLYGQNDLFKFNHYYDVGKRKYNYNFTNTNNRIFTDMKTRPFSKSIDSFRRTNINENQTPITLEKINIVDNEPLVQPENHDDVPRISYNDNELVTHEDNDLNILQYSPTDHVIPAVPVDIKTFGTTSSTLSESDKTETVDEHDEEFERNFLRAVDRALGVVNKDQTDLPEINDDKPQEIDQSNLNLLQMTEQALSSFNNSPLFTNDDQTNEQIDNDIELVDRIDEPSNVTVAEEEKEVINEEIWSIIDDLIQQIEDPKNGQTFLAKLDDEEKIIKSTAEAYNKLLQTDDHRLIEDVRTDINAVIGEVNLLLRGKLKQFRGLCESNVTKSTNGEPIPLDSDLEGFWDITYPLIDKVKEKFAKLDVRKTKQWAPIEEYDPNDVNNRPRVIDDRLKQLQPHQNKSSKIPTTKHANDDLKKLIQERRKAAANTANQNHDIEIFVAPK